MSDFLQAYNILIDRPIHDHKMEQYYMALEIFLHRRCPRVSSPQYSDPLYQCYMNGYFNFLRAPNKAYFERHKKGLFSHCWRTIYLFNLWGSVTNCGHICVDSSVVWCIVMGPFCAVFYWTTGSLIRHREVNAHY